MLGESLRSLLLGRSQEEWDLVLPQTMRAYRSTPHSSPLEAPRFLMLGQVTRVSEHLIYHVPTPESNVHEYVDELITRMRTAHEVLGEQQWQLRSGNSDDPLLCLRWETGSESPVTAGGTDRRLCYSGSLWVLSA